MNSYRLDELGFIGRGKSKHRPRNDESLYGGKYPFIQTADVKHSSFYITKHSQTYNEKGLKQSKLWDKGTLCITIAANIADTAILDYPACFPDSIVGFIPHKDLADVKFVKYCLDTYQKQMRLISQGTTQDNMSLEKIMSLKFLVPPLQIQKKIASILTAYDDLIEINNRRIQLLENMAEEIYREWFVRLRFPGYKKVKVVKGVPEGWKVVRLRDIVSFYIGGGWGQEYKNSSFSEKAFVIRGTDIPKLTDNEIIPKVCRFHKVSNIKTRAMKEFDFIFEVSGGSKDQLLGRNMMITDALLKQCNGKVIPASFCKLIRFDLKKVSPNFMRFFLKLYYSSGLVGLFQVQSTGISNYQFESFLDNQTVLMPTKLLTNEFDQLVIPILKQKDQLCLSNQNLIKTRDALLPRLISGKLSVENLDIQFPPSMKETSV